MAYEAAFWRDSGDDERPELSKAQKDRSFARYVDGWGRAGDVALVALDRHDEPLGAAWYRLYPSDDAGYGYISPYIPEITIGVYGEYRGQGIGSLLLGSLVTRAKASDLEALSLSVEPDNPSRRLYLRVGFADVGSNGGAITMRLDLT